jgi:mxaJ protein
MAVRKDDRALRRELNRAIERRRADIDAILAAYHVPVLSAGVSAAPDTGGAKPLP